MQCRSKLGCEHVRWGCYPALSWMASVTLRVGSACCEWRKRGEDGKWTGRRGPAWRWKKGVNEKQNQSLTYPEEAGENVVTFEFFLMQNISAFGIPTWRYGYISVIKLFVIRFAQRRHFCPLKNFWGLVALHGNIETLIAAFITAVLFCCTGMALCWKSDMQKETNSK